MAECTPKGQHVRAPNTCYVCGQLEQPNTVFLLAGGIRRAALRFRGDREDAATIATKVLRRMDMRPVGRICNDAARPSFPGSRAHLTQPCMRSHELPTAERALTAYWTGLADRVRT